MYRIFDAKMFSMLSPLLFYQQDLGTSLRWLTWRWSCPQDWQAADEKVKAYDKNHGNKFFHVMRWSQLLRRYALGSIIRSETLPVPFKLMGRRRRAEGMWFHLQVWLLAGMKQKLHFIDVVGRYLQFSCKRNLMGSRMDNFGLQSNYIFSFTSFG